MSPPLKLKAPRKLRPKRHIPELERKLSEDQIQQALFRQWQIRGTPNSTFIHIPNEGRRSVVEGYRLKKMGMTPGTPDLLLRGDPDYLCPGTLAEPFFLELKKPGVVATPERRAQLAKLVDKGWLVWLVDGLDMAIALLEEHGVLKRGYGLFGRL